LSTEHAKTAAASKPESQAALLVVGLLAIYAVMTAASLLLFAVPWLTAAIGAGWAGAQWSPRRAPGVFRAISIIWGVGLLVLGVTVALAG
jgi:hypothetical protein